MSDSSSIVTTALDGAGPALLGVGSLGIAVGASIWFVRRAWGFFRDMAR